MVFLFGYSATVPSEPWRDPLDIRENNEMARKGFRSIYTITPIGESKFDEIEKRGGRRGYTYLDGLYDGMLLYATAINKTINQSITNHEESFNFTGYGITKNMWGISFTGIFHKNTIRPTCYVDYFRKGGRYPHEL